jgi:hypothetical protein
MGPNSKAAVVELLGALLVEARQQRAAITELRRELERWDESQRSDNVHTSRRVTQIERTLRDHGIAVPEVSPLPAE